MGSEYSAILEQASRLIDKPKDAEGTGSCSEAELDLEFGIGKSFRDRENTFKDFVSENNNRDPPVVSETIVLASSGGARKTIEKWGALVQIFGNFANIDCPCEAVCKNRAKVRREDDRLRYLGKRVFL